MLDFLQKNLLQIIFIHLNNQNYNYAFYPQLENIFNEINAKAKLRLT